MFKRTFSKLLIYGGVLSSLSVYASPWNGAYVSLLGGTSAFQGQVNTTMSLSHRSDLLNQTRIHRELPMAGVALGYGRLFHCHWYLGTEIGFEQFLSGNGFSSSSQTRVGSMVPFDYSTTNTLRPRQSFSWSALMGYQWRQYLSYIRLGYVNTQMSYQNDLLLLRGQSTPTHISNQRYLSLNGIRVGLGVKAAVSKHVSVGAEVNYTQYANRRVAFDASTDAFNVNTQASAALTGLKTLNTMVSLSYHF